VDELLDDHATEFEECRRWASSDAGQIARVQNPAGFANVRAHAAEHAAALARQQAGAQAQTQAALLASRLKSQSSS
jgi:glutathione S-transferase